MPCRLAATAGDQGQSAYRAIDLLKQLSRWRSWNRAPNTARLIHTRRWKFDRVLILPHAVSALEEAHVKWQVTYLIMAVLLTVLEGIVTVYFGKAISIAWTGDLPARGLLVFLAALEATSLANVWVQCGSGLHVWSQSANARLMQNVTPTGAEERGQSDV